LYTVLFAGIDHQEAQKEVMDHLSKPTKLILNPFNYFEWKTKISLLLRSKGLYRVTMGTEKEPTAAAEKIKYFNKLDEAIGLICLSISRDLLFHVSRATTPDVVWTTLEGLFGKQDAMRVHQLENELISLSPIHFRNLQELFTKFKSLLVELNACGVTKEEEQLILSILSKLGPKYFVFVSSFQASKLTQEKWKMPPLNDFIAALTQEKDKLVQMGSIKRSKNQALVATDAPKRSGKDKQKGKGKFPESKKERSAQSSDNSSEPKGKKKKEITLFIYCSKGFHPEENCMRKTIDEMAKQLQQHNLTVPENAKKKDDNRTGGRARDGHALMVFTSTPSTWILDLGASNHVAASKDEFSSIEESTRSPIYLGDATPAKVCEEGIVDLEGGCFTNVLHVPFLSTNLFLIYQITYFDSGRKVEFTPDFAVITDISTGSQLAHGIADHGSRLYFFSHFVPKSISTIFLSQSNDISRLWHEIFGHLNYKYLHQLSKENMVEGLPTIKFTSGVCQGCILGKHPEKKFDKGKAQRASSPLGMIHSDIMGPFPQPSISKARYVLTFIDDFSRFTWVFFLKLKSEVFECLIEFKALAENESGCKIKILRTDNGGDYFKKYVQQLCIDAGIQLQHKVPYTPQQNGVAERKNRSLKEMANCMLQSKSLAPKLWDEDINCATYI
jgi:hypothetical protein